jgi:hypothetical protein
MEEARIITLLEDRIAFVKAENAKLRAGETEKVRIYSETAEAWRYRGYASRGGGAMWGTYISHKVVFDPDQQLIVMNVFYQPVAAGSVAPYKTQYHFHWDTITNALQGKEGCKWKGVIEGGAGGNFELTNQWNGRIVHTAVEQLPASAVEADLQPRTHTKLPTGFAEVCASVPQAPPGSWAAAAMLIQHTSDMPHYATPEGAACRAEAFTWLVAAIEPAETNATLKEGIKQLIGCDVFTLYFEPAQLDMLKNKARARLQEIAAPAAEYFVSEQLGTHLGSLGKEHAERARLDVPSPGGNQVFYAGPGDQTCMSELVYIEIVRMVGIALDSMFHDTAKTALGNGGLDEEGYAYNRAPPKKSVRMRNKLDCDHKDEESIRSACNIDVVRSLVVFDSGELLVEGARALEKAFGSVARSKNGFLLSQEEASEHFHYRTFMLNPNFEPGTTFGELAAASKEMWQADRDERGEEERAPIEQAIAFLQSPSVAATPVRFVCEVQLVLTPHKQARDKMHLWYKIFRADSKKALWRDFSGEMDQGFQRWLGG